LNDDLPSNVIGNGAVSFDTGGRLAGGASYALIPRGVNNGLSSRLPIALPAMSIPVVKRPEEPKAVNPVA
jgi:hypothetical protein